MSANQMLQLFIFLFLLSYCKSQLTKSSPFINTTSIREDSFKFWRFNKLPWNGDREDLTDIFKSIRNFANSRIVGGDDAKSGEFPWQVWLVWLWSDELFASCGGVLISKNGYASTRTRTIVTAAHCVVDPNGYMRKLFFSFKNSFNFL